MHFQATYPLLVSSEESGVDGVVAPDSLAKCISLEVRVGHTLLDFEV